MFSLFISKSADFSSTQLSTIVILVETDYNTCGNQKSSLTSMS